MPKKVIATGNSVPEIKASSFATKSEFLTSQIHFNAFSEATVGKIAEIYKEIDVMEKSLKSLKKAFWFILAIIALLTASLLAR